MSSPHCRHPAYSINGILGIPQATSDANDNLLKRKREEDEDTRGEEVEYLAQNCHFYIFTFHTFVFFSHYDFIGQRRGRVQESSNPVHKLVPPTSQCLGGQVGEWPGEGTHSESSCGIICTHQVKQEKAGGQEQVSTSPYPTTFPEALAFPNYEAAMNQYTSVSPTQGWQALHTILRSSGLKSDTTPTVRLSFNTARSYSGQYQGSAGGQYVGAGGQGQYGQYGSYGYAGHNLGGLQSK